MLDLTDRTITIDAMGCQTTIAKKIVASGAHYILAVKDNQSHLLDDIEEAFAHEQPANISVKEQSNLGHSRIEKRTRRVITDMDWICSRVEWKGLNSIIEISAEITN